MNDFRFALRQLLKNPGFTTIAVLTLALGIGANTAIFTVAYGVLLKPLPLPQSDRVVSLWETKPGGKFDKVPAAAPNYLDWKAQAKSFAALSAWQPSSVNVGADGGSPERWTAASVHEDFFQVAGVSPALGRTFAPEHFQTGEDAVAILGHGVWQERFGGSPDVIGRTIQLNGRIRTIIGIMPPGFQSPGLARVWLPKVFNAGELADRGFKSFYVLGRLAPGVTVTQADRELAGMAANLAREYPAALEGWTAFAHAALEDVAQPLRLPLLVLLAAVGVVLLMACVNVANLLLARGSGRTGEMALRVALGAERRHLLRQLGTESLLLAALGGTAGILFTAFLLKVVVAAAPAGLPRVSQITLDLTALGYTLGAALLTALLFGFAPAWQLIRVHPVQALREASDQTTARGGRISRSLIVFQVAAAMVVLIATGLLVRSFEQLLRADLGFRAEELLTVRLELPRGKYGGDGRRAQFAESLVEKLTAISGVESAAVTSQLPFQGWPRLIMRVEGRPKPRQSDAPSTGFSGVTADYFRTLGQSVLRGRNFTSADHARSPLVCVVNEVFARQHFPGEDPLGRRIEVGFSEPPRWLEIVGLVRDARNQSVETQPQPEVLVPLSQQSEILGTAISVAIRTRAGSPDVVPALRQAVWSLDPDQPLHNLKPMQQILVESTAQRRFTLILLATFAGLALLLTLVGLYGVLAYAVSRRRREIGIRLALGSPRGRVMRLVLGDGLRLALVGIALGLIGAFGATRVLGSMLYQIAPTDPLTFAAIPILLLGVGLLACWLPAWRASRANPIEALRNQG